MAKILITTETQKIDLITKISLLNIADNWQYELTKKNRVRTITQNSALHLLFTHISKALISLSIDYHYTDLFSGEIVYIPYNDYLVKEFIWKPIQKTMFGITSTKELDTPKINAVLEVLQKFFADRGIQINFPSRIDLLIKELEKSNRL